MKHTFNMLTVAIAVSSGAQAWAQQSVPEGGHPGHQDMIAQAGTTAPAPKAMDGMGSMDHGDMNMQGGSPPSDARDPHGYSGGYRLETGKYALPGPRQLRLADEHHFASILIDRLEREHSRDGDAAAYDAQAWFGRDYDRLVIKAEGDYERDQIRESRTEFLWGHAIADYWDTQIGVRHDDGEGPDRNWLTIGIQGLAPYWFELDAAAYFSDKGRSALRVESEYELLITQRVVLQPRVEINFYGKNDEANGIGEGLSEAIAGIRVRYELSRQFAPYVGVEWAGKFGKTADLARDEGERTRETRWVAGLRFWF